MLQADRRATESWNNFVEASDIIETIKAASDEWDPAVISLLEQSPTRIVDWDLRVRDCAETWVSPNGRILRLGDCAHAFLPTSGNGAVQAIEDAISIAECLRIAGKANVGWSTRVHNKLRFVLPFHLPKCVEVDLLQGSNVYPFFNKQVS